MKIQRQICPSCAAPLPASITEFVRCEHCGSDLHIKKDTGQLTPSNTNVQPSYTATAARKPMSRSKRWVITGTIISLIVGAIFFAFIYSKYNWHRVINGVAWSPDGKHLASVHGQGWDIGGGTLRIWDAATGKSSKVIHNKDVLMWQVIWSPDGRYLATGEQDGKTEIWDAETLQVSHKLQGAGSSFVENLIWSPDGKSIAAGDENGTLRVWDAATGKQMYSQFLHANRIEATAWSPDGKYLATGGWDSMIRIVDAATGQMLKEFKDASYIDCLAWSADSKFLATGGLSNLVRIIDVSKGVELFALTGHKNTVHGVVWSPNGKLVASVGQDDTVRVWDAATGKMLQVLDNHGYNANALWSPDGKYLASGGNGMLRIWDTANWNLQQFQAFGRGNDVLIAGWSADSKQLLTVGKYDEVIKLWDVGSGKQIYSLQVSIGEAVWRSLF